MSMKKLVGKSMTKKTKFLGEEIVIKKLSVAQVMELQAKFKETENSEDNSMEILKTVIRQSTEDGDQLSDEEFNEFPVEELSNLSAEILKFSGLGNVEKPAKGN
jgi:hypothetical protein